ncbi:MAG TPA: error-prone DNA polymerase [Steroidobacteraceae bacterium]|nr:error-prone DNA polymerase [Steroidobacteraceae bacterium]
MDGPDYAELHALSNFTFLRGASHPEELVERADELGYRALALTDECSLAGVVRAHVAARDRPLRLIVGSELCLEDGLRLVLLATDRAAYGDLVALLTRGRRAAPKGRYRLGRADLEAEPLAGCLALWLPGAEADAAQGAWVRERFGADAWLAVELLAAGRDRERLAGLEALGRRLGLAPVASGDVHLHRRERQRLQDALTAVRLGLTVETAGLALYPNAERYLKARAELARRYPAALLAATLPIAERATFSLDALRYEYPEELVPAGHTPTSWLGELAATGLARRFPGGAPAAVRALVERELALIAELGYEPFFLTVEDLVRFARSQGILCQGRGSAANSAVCYCLGITEVDPSRMSLLFERFVSKERNEPPDIDVDFEHERREEVIQYLYAKYGRHRAALAATVISYRPRSALRDIGKALGLDALTCERLARSMQWWDGNGIDAERVREAGLDPGNPTLGLALGLARELVGFPRHLSQHVGGFVIARRSLAELVPVENAAMAERTVIEWDKDDLDDLGLLKVDVLGLGMLTAIRRALALVGARRGRPFAMADVPAEDAATYEMISHADTVGVFQIESRAQMAMLPRLRPRSYYDLVIEVAIIRPGPIQGDMVHPYLRRRNGEEPVSYPSAEVQGVLERTLGVPIFQEQVMQLAVVAAGFTPGEADRLRRAMAAWKRRGGLGPFEARLIEGMRARGYPESFARAIFNQILGFGEYGFPECVVGATRVVDADRGAWVTIDDAVAGRAALRTTLSCDARGRLRRRAVRAVRASGVRPVFRLQTASGCAITATAEHPFLTTDGWRTLGALGPGARLAAAGPAGPPPRAGAAVGWDEVLAIEARGDAPTYDLSVEGEHNFLADGLVVHNSHAASFAHLVYVSAWLKCHEPAAFAAALLNSQPMGFYAPAQLVRDAREHGVAVLGVDVNLSAHDATLEGEPPALRLGLRQVRGLSAGGGERLLAARGARRFDSVQDLAERAGLERRDLGALAASGALAALAGHRHRAAWEVGGVVAPTPLFATTRIAEGAPLLRAPREGEDIVADYRSLGLTLGRHPVALLRERLEARGLLSAARLRELPHGARARACGLVLVRQRPGSASGVTFVTLEDETGVVNLVVWRNIAERWRRPLLESRLLEAGGELQREGEVLHLIVERLVDRSRLLGDLIAPSRDFH